MNTYIVLLNEAACYGFILNHTCGAKNDKAAFHITAKALPYGTQEIESVTAILLAGTLKKDRRFLKSVFKE